MKRTLQGPLRGGSGAGEDVVAKKQPGGRRGEGRRPPTTTTLVVPQQHHASPPATPLACWAAVCGMMAPEEAMPRSVPSRDRPAGNEGRKRGRRFLLPPLLSFSRRLGGSIRALRAAEDSRSDKTPWGRDERCS